MLSKQSPKHTFANHSRTCCIYTRWPSTQVGTWVVMSPWQDSSPSAMEKPLRHLPLGLQNRAEARRPVFPAMPRQQKHKHDGTRLCCRNSKMAPRDVLSQTQTHPRLIGTSLQCVCMWVCLQISK